MERSTRKNGGCLKWTGFGCVGLVALFIILIIIGAIVGGDKSDKTTSGRKITPRTTSTSTPRSTLPSEKIEGIGVTEGTIPTIPTPLPSNICRQADLEIHWDLDTLSLANNGENCEVRGVQLTIYPLNAPTLELLDHRYTHYPIELGGGEIRVLSISDGFYDLKNARCPNGRPLDQCAVEDLLYPIFDTSVTTEIGCSVRVSVPKTLPRNCHIEPQESETPKAISEVHVVSNVETVVERFKASTGEIPLNLATLERISDAEEKLTIIFTSWNIIDPSPSLPVDPADNSISISLWDEDPRVPQLDAEDIEILSGIASDLYDAPEGFASLNLWRPEFVEWGTSCDVRYRETAEALINALRNLEDDKVAVLAFIQSAQSLRSAQACIGKRSLVDATK